MVRGRIPGVVVWVCSCFSAGPLFGQTPSAPDEARQAVDIRAVERGFFFEGDVGFAIWMKQMEGARFLPGIDASMLIGFDVAPMVAILAGATAFAAPSSADTAERIDMFFVTPTALAQVALYTTERNFVYVRGGVGFALGLPQESRGSSLDASGFAFSGAVGFEHYTRLRHFSIGWHGGVVGLTKPDFGLAFSFMPTLKYTF